MPPRRDFRSEKPLNVINFKGGKVVRKSKLSVPVRYAAQQVTHLTPSAGIYSVSGTNTSDSTEGDLHCNLSDEPRGLRRNKKAKVRKVRIKRKLKAYHERKARLAASWLNVREQLVTALLSRQALPLRQMCVIPSCEEEARGRCLNCSPGQYLCEAHINSVHAGGRSLHLPEIWKVCTRCDFI